jgi:transcriptional regulator with XRE-family HTH domain
MHGLVVPKRRPPYDEAAHRRALGEAVARLRHHNGMTQEALAEAADLHRSYIASLETGSRNPTLDVIVKLAQALNVSPSDLLT